MLELTKKETLGPKVTFLQFADNNHNYVKRV
jgi:hypothetical protein